MEEIFDYLIENYYKKYGQYSGEGIMQSDKPLIEAPDILSDIADDIIKFEVEYTDL
jgi:hypothetical protein